jgi:hypothetical protein
METLLFVVSAVCVIKYSISVLSCVMGNSFTVPMPLLHMFDITYTNCYVTTLALGYQVYFWATHFNMVGGF